MDSYRLTLRGGPRYAEWVLGLDGPRLSLTDPDDRPVLAAELAHRAVDLYDLYAAGTITLATPHGPLSFRRHRPARRAVRTAVEAGLTADADFREGLRRRSLRSIPEGVAMFVVAGGLFGLYCWWAFTDGDPPPGTWMRWVLVWFGWLIHLLLCVLLAATLAGPWVSYVGFRQWLRVRRIERAAARAASLAEPGAAADPAS